MNMVKKAIVTGIAAITLSTAAQADDQIAVFIDVIDTTQTYIEQPDNQRMSAEWTLTEEHEGIKQVYMRSAEKELKEDGYVVVTNEADADLSIKATLVELDPAAPKDRTFGREPFARYITEGAGDITIEYTVIGEGVNETFVKEQAAGTFWGENDRFNNRANTIRAFNRLADKLADEVEDLI